jgi:aminomethyltransferase
VPVDKAQPGTKLEIDVRGRTRTAEVRDKPLYKKEN